jgi:hypothetical protein
VNHIDILKRAFSITWRYRALWIFGFLLALCGGGGSGGGGNFNFPGGGSGGDFGDGPGMPSIDTNTIIAIVVGIFCLILLLIGISVLVQVVTRTALIGMVRQITETEAVTIRDGWRFGWSRRAWRLFLVGVIIGVPWAVISIGLILVALAPLLLLLTENTALTVIGVIITVVAFLFVLFILIVVGAGVVLFLDLARQQVVLADLGLIASLGETVGLIKSNLKDVAILWILMLGVGIGWAIVSIFVVLVAFLVAAIVGGIPALLVYLITESVIGAAIAGGPLALLIIMVISAAAGGFYLIFRSAVWTLAYLEFSSKKASAPKNGDSDAASLI